MQSWTAALRLPAYRSATSQLSHSSALPAPAWQLARAARRSYSAALQQSEGDEQPMLPIVPVSYERSQVVEPLVRSSDNGAAVSVEQRPVEKNKGPEKREKRKRYAMRRWTTSSEQVTEALAESKRRGFHSRLRIERQKARDSNRLERTKTSKESDTLRQTRELESNMGSRSDLRPRRFINPQEYKRLFKPVARIQNYDTLWSSGKTAHRRQKQSSSTHRPLAAASRRLPAWAFWKRQIGKIEVNYRKLAQEDVTEARVVTDPRAPAWVEDILDQLDGGRTLPDVDALADISLDDSPVELGGLYVWSQAALWLLAHDPRNAIAFLEATHVSPYVPAAYVQDVFQCLASFWLHGKEADRMEKMGHMASLFCTLADRGGGEPLRLIHPCVRWLMKESTHEQIMEMYQAVKRYQVTLHWNTHLHFATYFAKHDLFEEAYGALRTARIYDADVNSRAFLSNCATLLRRSSSQPDGLRVCLRLVSELVDMGMKPNIQICNIIMLNAIEAGDRSTALSVYRSLVQRELKPDEYTFAILLKACKMNIDDAELLNQIIRDAIESVNLRKAEVVAFEILYCLILHHTKHNRRTALATVTDACAQLFDLQPLEKLGLPIPKRQQQQADESMPLWPPAANLLITMSIEHVLSAQSDVEAVAALYARWREFVNTGEACLARLATDDYTANIFLMAFIKHSNGLLHASRVIRDMQQTLPPSAGVTQCKPTVQSWSIFLHGFTRHGKPKLAEQILTYMRGQGIEPNHVTWSTLLTGYARAQDEEGVLDGLRQVQQSGFVWEEWMEGATRGLKQKGRVVEELQKAKLVKRLNFMEELKRELEGRLSAAADVAKDDLSRPS